MMQAGLGAFSPSRVGVAQPVGLSPGQARPDMPNIPQIKPSGTGQAVAQPVGLSPGQARPDMPNIPQIKPSGTGQAAALPSKVDYLVGIPREYLLQALMSPAEDPPKWAIVTALDQQAKEADIKKRAEGAAAQRQVAGLGTVVQDVATRRLARGGVVGFDKGGGVGTQEEADRRKILGLLEQAGYGAQNLAAAGIDVLTLPVRALAGIYNTVIRVPRAFGADIPFVPAAAGTESMTPLMDALTRSRAATAVEPPAGQPGGAFRGIRADMASAGVTPPTAPASAVPANIRGLGTGIDRSSRTPPPADTAPPPQTDGFDIKALQDAMRAAGTVSPAVQAARDALEKQRQASLSARERRREAIASEGRSYGQLARATVGAKSFGEALALAAGAAADQRAEKNKRLQELDDAADRLREALAEKALADRSADDAARKQADVEVLKAQRDYLDKQRTFRIQEQEAQARTTAAERSGSSGGESRGLSAQVTGLNNLIKAADDTMNNMMLKQEVRDAAAKDKARYIRLLEALLSGNSSLSGMSTEDLLKVLGATGGATR